MDYRIFYERHHSQLRDPCSFASVVDLHGKVQHILKSDSLNGNIVLDKIDLLSQCRLVVVRAHNLTQNIPKGIYDLAGILHPLHF